MKKTLYNLEYFQKRDALPLHLALTLKQFFQNYGVKNVLEVGCGTGKMTKFLKSQGFKTVGCDASPLACKISKQIQAKATSLPFADGQFDAVVAISLLEHLSKKQGIRFIKETHRILKNNGLIFLVTPNFFSPMRFFWRKKWFAYQDPSHITFYTPLSLLTMLKKEGFAQFCFWFKKPKDLPFDWPLPILISQLPKIVTDLISFLAIATPLALFRDSLWLGAKKF